MCMFNNEWSFKQNFGLQFHLLQHLCSLSEHFWLRETIKLVGVDEHDVLEVCQIRDPLVIRLIRRR